MNQMNFIEDTSLLTFDKGDIDIITFYFNFGEVLLTIIINI